MPNNNNNVIVRIAPSPTGPLHVGITRTALFNYLFAKHNNGKFILRIEDTDKERSRKKYEKDILSGLKWFGIDWDGKIYYQSKRINIYKKYLKKLLKEGSAFYCWHAKEELEKEKNLQMKQKEAPRHLCEYRNKKMNDASTKDRSIIRFKNDSTGVIKFNDLVRGEIKFTASDFGDFSIAKDLKKPLYNFAVVVDDYEMKLTHVIRGEDHISNTPRQILLQRKLGFTSPVYAHIPLILGADKSKLSKRHGATSIMEYKEAGYLPSAMFNFLALLGWRGKDDEKEILTKEEIIKEFLIEDVQKSPAVFDIEKLSWMNGEYIRALKPAELANLAAPYLGKVNSKKLEKIVALEQPRIKKLEDIAEATNFFFEEPKYDPALLIWKNMSLDELKNILLNLHDIIEAIGDSDWNKAALEKIIMPEAEKLKNRGIMLWPLRVALSGKKASPGPFEIMEILDREVVLTRLEKAQDLIKN